VLARSVGILLAVCACACGVARAQSPVAVLVEAVKQTNAAPSASLVVIEQVELGGQLVTTVRMSGTEDPRDEKGSFLYGATPDAAGLGDARIIVDGATDYVHYGVFDSLRASNPSVKSWLVVDTASSLGMDPAGFASLEVGEVSELTGLRVAGAGTEDGIAVTRYVGTLALAKIASSKELQGLLAAVPSEAKALLKGTERLEISVGSDGFIHEVAGLFEAPFGGGTSLSVTVSSEMTNFDRTPAAISAPPASEVMTPAQFQRATKSKTTTPGGAPVS